MSRRVLAAAGAVVAAATLVGLGRVEQDRYAGRANAGIRAVRAAIGGDIDGPTLDRYSTWSGPTCLLYSPRGRLYGIELCIDSAGRIVEAVDARGGGVRAWSVRSQPSLATGRVPPESLLGAVSVARKRAVVAYATELVRSTLGTCYDAARQAVAMSRRPGRPSAELPKVLAGVARSCGVGARRIAPLTAVYGPLLVAPAPGGVARSIALARSLAGAAAAAHVEEDAPFAAIGRAGRAFRLHAGDVVARATAAAEPLRRARERVGLSPGGPLLGKREPS